MEQGQLAVSSEKLIVNSSLAFAGDAIRLKSPIGDLGVKGQSAIAMTPWLVVKTKTR